MMKSSELVAKVVDIAKHYKTLYVMGCFGAPLTDTNKSRYRQTYAFAKIAQYFQALAVVGRFDLLLVYLMTIVMLFYYCFPLQLAVECFCTAVNTEKKVWASAALNILLFLYAFMFTRYYNLLYDTIAGKLFWVFLIFADLIPVLCLCLNRKPREGKKNTEKKTGTTKKEKGYA